MAEVIQNLEFTSGDTLFSPHWYLTNEDVPTDITKDEFNAGLQNGTYTLADLSQFDITALITDSDGGTFLDISLYMSTSDNVLSFVLPTTATASFPKSRNELNYEVRLTDTVSGHSTTVVAGLLVVQADSTYTGGVFTHG